METTIKQLRELIDSGLIAEHEVKGHKVKVGFMSLTVTGYKSTPNYHGMPNTWLLESPKGKLYEFTPYNGLQAV
jgi:DNA-binding HxlR family transcriptional regulator